MKKRKEIKNMIKVTTEKLTNSSREILYAEIKEIKTATSKNGQLQLRLKLDDGRSVFATDREEGKGPASVLTKLKIAEGSKILIDVNFTEGYEVGNINAAVYARNSIRYKDGEGRDKYVLFSYTCNQREYGNGNLSVTMPVRVSPEETKWYQVSFLGAEKKEKALKELAKGKKTVAIVCDSLRETTTESGKVFSDLIGRYIVPIE